MTGRFRTRRSTRRIPVIASGAAVVILGSPGPGASTSSSTPGSPIGPGSQHFELHSRTAIKIVVAVVAAILRRIRTWFRSPGPREGPGTFPVFVISFAKLRSRTVRACRKYLSIAFPKFRIRTRSRTRCLGIVTRLRSPGPREGPSTFPVVVVSFVKHSSSTVRAHRKYLSIAHPSS